MLKAVWKLWSRQLTSSSTLLLARRLQLEQEHYAGPDAPQNKGTHFEVKIIESDGTSSMACTRDIHNARSRWRLEQRAHEEIGEEKVAQMISTEL